MRHLLFRGLRQGNRWLKRLLGLPIEVTHVDPAVTRLLDRLGPPAAYISDCRPKTLVFVLENVSRGSGGLADILHLGTELRNQLGWSVMYHSLGGEDYETSWRNMRWANSAVTREEFLRELDFVPECLCATAWPSVYEILRRPSRRKMYFVQDYEPWFHRAGLEQYYATRTYEQGLEMFTLGPWLAGKIESQHKVGCAGFMPFPVCDEAQPGRPLAERRLISFYVQPDKPQRGSEMLLEAARRLSRDLRRDGPELEIAIFGSADNEYLKLDFPGHVYGVLSEGALTDLLQRTRIGVCSSFTNVSLITFRFMAHGCQTLDLDLPNVQINVPECMHPLCRFYAPDPDHLLGAIHRALAAPPEEPVRQAAVTTLCRNHAWSACARAVAPLFR